MDVAIGWLLRAEPVPGSALAEWAGTPDRAAELVVGRVWDVVQAPVELALEALDVLRYREPVGPALLCVPDSVVSILVPAGSAARWTALGPQPPGVAAVGGGRRLRVPVPRQSYGPLHWLIPPDGSGRLTDLLRLHSALRRARTTTVRRGG